ncbi:MAG: methyltransferase domain-containing protein [Candidatus ainarchaeum sp.]|nr:methyltransferase domain-containing protein [Candidatus ainarchaeum sp.]
MNFHDEILLRVWKTNGKILDLGCGDKKIPNAFGVDFIKTRGTDLEWDLEKILPKKFWNSYDLVYSASVLDHLGNPLNFLENCARYSKPCGIVQVIVDNADYWRFHKKSWPFGNYHSTLWFKESRDIKVQHKMMFQAGHLENLFALAGLEVIKKEFFYKAGIDKLLPEHLGSAFISIIGKKH